MQSDGKKTDKELCSCGKELDTYRLFRKNIQYTLYIKLQQNEKKMCVIPQEVDYCIKNYLYVCTYSSCF